MSLRRIFLFFFVFTLFVFGHDKRELIENGYISIDGQTYKNAKEYDLNNEYFKKFTIRLDLNKELLKNKINYLSITCDVQSLKEANIAYERNFDTILVKLDENIPEQLYFIFEYAQKKPLNFRVLPYDEFEYEYILKNQNILYGIAYGIIFSAFLYNLVIFLNTYQRSFLYYSLMQLFLLIILADVVYLSTTTFISDAQRIFIDVLENLCMIMTILFSKEILNTKKHMKIMDKLLYLLIIINIIDTVNIFNVSHSVLYDYLPRSVVLSVLVFAGLIAVVKGQKTAIFYLLGWAVLFLSLLLSEYHLIELDELFVVHIGFPLESLILSFALGYKLKKSVRDNNEKEQLLVHQSKLASMGEMINNIAHQWRQPLTHLSFINMDLQMAKECEELNKQYLDQKINESHEQIEFMSQTIDNFKDFYQPVKEKETFLISEATQKAINIIKPSLNNLHIELQFCIKEDTSIKAYENEYSQIVLNLLTNAKDVLSQRKIKNPNIKITLEKYNKKSLLIVQDNAQGIEEHIIHKIFDPYFTTKHKSSGIGLYMSKVIVESHLQGAISAYNTTLGACFKVEV